MSDADSVIVTNPWQALRRFTDARIALGRAGVSLPTQAHLAFTLAHAQARDAVHEQMDVEALRAQLQGLGDELLLLHSAAPDRESYLRRPDLGRSLSADSQRVLSERGAEPLDLVLVLADGLSARAVMHHAAPLLALLLPRLRDAGWSLAPLVLVEQARVAVGDAIGQALRARMAAVLIGERPGLSAPDSLGVYLSWAPAPGLTDAQRNCLSNIRPAGLSYDAAAEQLWQLMQLARAQAQTGVGLKAPGREALPPSSDGACFLLPASPVSTVQSTIEDMLTRGRQARAASRLEEARSCFFQAADLSRREGPAPLLAESLQGLGQIARDLGELELALSHHQEADRLYEDSGLVLPHAHTLRHVGDVLFQLGRVLPAQEACQRALLIYRASPAAAALDLANALRSTALTEEQAAGADAARALWEEARALYASQDVGTGVAECELHLGASGA